MHCSSDLLIYFGSDLSSSGSIPVMIIPPNKTIDMENLIYNIEKTVNMILKDCKVLILYEISYYNEINKIVNYFSGINIESFIAKIPIAADLINWQPDTSHEQQQKNDNFRDLVCIGGLFIEPLCLGDNNIKVFYIGEKTEQLVNISLGIPSVDIVHYSPMNSFMTITTGNSSIEFRERYGGVLRVKDAKTIGIIIGSMGISGETLKKVLNRLQLLISAAGKKYYSFVMGRLNEAKLCNFPEVNNCC